MNPDPNLAPTTREVCRLCGQPIGYGRSFYGDGYRDDGTEKLLHAECVERQYRQRLESSRG